MDPYLVPIAVVDLWVFRRVTDPPENGRLASVCPPDDKDPETAEFLTDVVESRRVFCRHSGVRVREVKRRVRVVEIARNER